MTFQGASSSKEFALAREEMHSLAGAAVTIGAIDLAEMAKHIEKMPIEEVLSHRDSLVVQLDALLQKTLVEIEKRYLNPTRVPGA